MKHAILNNKKRSQCQVTVYILVTKCMKPTSPELGYTTKEM